MEKNECKILWLSDIHFSEKYKKALDDEPELKLYFIRFITKIHELIIQDNNRQFDYVFLTGDLAQAGIMSDYELFFRHVLQPLLDLFITIPGKKPKVIAIPGNHDVDWQKSDFLKNYVQKINPKLKKDMERAKWLEENIEEFHKLFSDYSKFMLEYVMDVEGGKYKEFFTLTTSPRFFVSPAYQQHRLFGYLIDHERHLIINLVNTAWYSLGGKFNDILADLESDMKVWNLYDVNLADPKEFPTVNELARHHTSRRLREILNKKEQIVEYNNQITGINLFELNQLKKDQSEFSEYFVVSCLHHPFNWLKWNEQYDFNSKDGETNAAKLKQLTELSSLILTGHEHVPKEILGERRSERSLLLKSGCFLFDNQHSEVSLKNGWFSVLNIDPDRTIVRHDKHFYDVVDEELGTVQIGDEWDAQIPASSSSKKDAQWRTLEHLPGKEEWYKLRKNSQVYQPESTRAKAVMKMVEQTSEHQLKKFMNAILAPSDSVTGIKLLDTDPNTFFFKINRKSAENQTEVCILVRKKQAYTMLRKKTFFERLIKVAGEFGQPIGIVRFLVLDLFVEDADVSKLSAYEQHKYAATDRIWQLQQRTGIADDMFDIMRCDLFLTMDQKYQRERKIPPEFALFRDAKFVNTVIPFWVAENIWR